MLCYSPPTAIISFSFSHISYLPPQYERSLIRILTAMRAFAEAESRSASQYLPDRLSGVVTLPFPRDGAFQGTELPRRARSEKEMSTNMETYSEAADSAAPEFPTRTIRVLPAVSEGDAPSSPEIDAVVERHYNLLGHPEWIPGSIFVHIGPGDIPLLLSGTSSSTPSTLPPLPHNPLIPPMVTVADTYRFPVFSIHRLFTHATADGAPNKDIDTLKRLISENPIFGPPQQRCSRQRHSARPSPPDPPGPRSSGDAHRRDLAAVAVPGRREHGSRVPVP
jgi:hypothetical protein